MNPLGVGSDIRLWTPSKGVCQELLRLEGRW